MEFRVRVDIVHRPGILDPQGATIERALPALGVDAVTHVAVGKVVRMSVEADDAAAAAVIADDLCRRLLANPVLEDYAVEVESEATVPPRHGGIVRGGREAGR